MRITTIAIYYPDTEYVHLHYPSIHAFHQNSRSLNIEIQAAVSELAHSSSTSPLSSIKTQNEWIYFKSLPNKSFLLFSTDAQLNDAILYQCFAMIQFHQQSDSSNMHQLVVEMESVCVEAAKLDLEAQLHFAQKAQQAEEDLEAIKSQMINNIEKIIERGEKINVVLAKTEALTQNALTFKTPAFKLFKPKHSFLDEIENLFSSDPCMPDRKKR